MPRKWLVRYLKGKWDQASAAPEPRVVPVAAAPRQRSYPPPRLPSLATAIRDYAWAVEANVLDRKSEADLDRWAAAMGPDIWSWQRARLLDDQPPWRASPDAEEEHERRRANEGMLKDIATWERALVVLDARIRRAKLYDRPVPPPLVVPQEVMALIEAKRAAALQRVGKARMRGEGGGSPPELKPDDDLSHIPFPSKPR